MISEANLVKALQKGAYRATAEYYQYSKTFLTQYAGESYMVACMAQDIMQTAKVPFLCLEYCSSTFSGDLKKSFPGPKGDFQRGSGRIDMTILNKDRQLKFAIEAKCNVAWNDTYLTDIERLVWFNNKLRRKEAKQSLIASIFIALVSSSSKISLEKSKELLSKKMEKWENNIKSRLDKIGSKNYSFYKGENPFSGIEYYKTKQSKAKNYTVSTSLCCVIK